jgi:hypothetical protein
MKIEDLDVKMVRRHYELGESYIIPAPEALTPSMKSSMPNWFKPRKRAVAPD